jgi:hypothetical protein
LADGWQKLSLLYDADSAGAIVSPDGTEKANQVFLSITTYAAQIAYGASIPTVSGHPLAVGDGITMDNNSWIQLAWLRNNAAGSNGVVIMTPIYEP